MHVELVFMGLWEETSIGGVLVSTFPIPESNLVLSIFDTATWAGGKGRAIRGEHVRETALKGT